MKEEEERAVKKSVDAPPSLRRSRVRNEKKGKKNKEV